MEGTAALHMRHHLSTGVCSRGGEGSRSMGCSPSSRSSADPAWCAVSRKQGDEAALSVNRLLGHGMTLAQW